MPPGLFAITLNACSPEKVSLTLPPAADAAPTAEVTAEAEVVSLNAAVMALVVAYPLGDAIPYAWSPDRHTDGVSQTLEWQGEVLAQPKDGGVHCSGITFEVYVHALRAVQGEEGLGPRRLRALKEAWYNQGDLRGGPVDALVEQGLGEAVPEMADLQPGDFVQLWRNNGNGHSAIFVEHTRWRSGALKGIVFWSAQSSSEGIGYRRVSIGDQPAQVSPGKLQGVRPFARLPQGAEQHHGAQRAQADADEQAEAGRR